MKKIISFIVCILLILTISVPAFAAETANVTCKVSNDVVKRGEKVTVTVSLNNSDPFKSMAITPIYDSDVFEMVSGEWLISGAMLSDFNKTSAAIAYASEVNKSGDIFAFVFDNLFFLKEKFQPECSTLRERQSRVLNLLTDFCPSFLAQFPAEGLDIVHIK